MMTRKRLLALLFTAISLLGLLPLSVSAITPAIEGVTYTYSDPTPDFPYTPQTFDGYNTDIVGTVPYMSFEGIPIEGFEGCVIDIFGGSVNRIGYLYNVDGYFVNFELVVDALVYVPNLIPIPTYLDDIPITFIIASSNSMTSSNEVAIWIKSEIGNLIVNATTDIKFTLTEILPNTNVSILNTTLKAFSSSQLTVDNYVDWILGGYSSITDVFVNNAKIQYVMDNPIIVIALVVFALAIAFAIATYIFKIFRRY